MKITSTKPLPGVDVLASITPPLSTRVRDEWIYIKADGDWHYCINDEPVIGIIHEWSRPGEGTP